MEKRLRWLRCEQWPGSAISPVSRLLPRLSAGWLRGIYVLSGGRGGGPSKTATQPQTSSNRAGWGSPVLLGVIGALLLPASTSCVQTPGGGAVEASTSQARALPSASGTRPVEGPGLHNLVAFHDGLVSGGVPEGDEAFARNIEAEFAPALAAAGKVRATEDVSG